MNGASGGPEHDFDLNRGLAIDTLLKDYPYLLQSPPDFEIFRKEIVLQDAQGFSISGLAAYQLFFAILRRLAQTASGLGVQPNVNVMLMDKYASDKGKIRLRWKIELFQKGRTATPLSDNERDAMLDKLGFKKPATQDGFSSGNGILEGISVYRLDAKGMISTHTIEVRTDGVSAAAGAAKVLPRWHSSNSVGLLVLTDARQHALMRANTVTRHHSTAK